MNVMYILRQWDSISCTLTTSFPECLYMHFCMNVYVFILCAISHYTAGWLKQSHLFMLWSWYVPADSSIKVYCHSLTLCIHPAFSTYTFLLQSLFLSFSPHPVHIHANSVPHPLLYEPLHYSLFPQFFML